MDMVNIHCINAWKFQRTEHILYNRSYGNFLGKNQDAMGEGVKTE